MGLEYTGSVLQPEFTDEVSRTGLASVAIDAEKSRRAEVPIGLGPEAIRRHDEQHAEDFAGHVERAH